MSDKIRRAKDLIGRRTENYVQATTQAYAKYFEGSPVYITYYRLDDIATKQDSSLENVHSLVGKNSPNKYQKIEDVVIYGVDVLDIMNEINEKGLQSLISGDFVLLPDTIQPYPGDFFVFDMEGMREHLFRVDAVQFDRATPKKFYRVSYAIYPDNADIVFGNLVTDAQGKEMTYVMNYDNIGIAGGQAVITKTAAVNAESAKKLVDGLIDKFANLFYDEDMDTFVFMTTNYEKAIDMAIWSPYLQKFLHNNKVLQKFNREILTEFYINDIGQRSNPDFFRDLGYRNSIFRKIETQDKRLSFENSFMSVLKLFNLKDTRNLPFFHSTLDYKLADVHSDNSFFFEAFHILEQEYHQTFESHPITHKFIAEDDISDNESAINDGDILYQVSTISAFVPIDVYKVFGDHILSISFSFLSKTTEELTQFFLSHGYTNSEIPEVLSVINSYLADQFLFSIIRNYLKGTLNLTQELIVSLNDHFYDISFKTYILLPIVIYILKQKIKEVYI
jgi:hypothetical protein